MASSSYLSIDNEVHHLRRLCDETFGEENFVAQLTWEKTRMSSVNYYSRRIASFENVTEPG